MTTAMEIIEQADDGLLNEEVVESDSNHLARKVFSKLDTKSFKGGLS